MRRLGHKPERKGAEMHKYGMRMRGFSLGCQPMTGLVNWEDDRDGYKSVLWYGRKLTKEEVECYELDYLGEENKR